MNLLKIKTAIIISFIFVLILNLESRGQNSISYVSNPIDPTSRTLDLTKDVGRITGKGGVSKNGNAYYNISLEIPPGTENIVPDLVIFYNSQADNSILGLKWFLSGISEISRAGSNVFEHGENKAIELNDDDNILLDGSELVLLNPPSGPYKSYTFQFECKKKSYLKIERIVDKGTSQDYFKVYKKDGTISTYGNTNGSHNGLKWKITKVEDLNGNFMEFNYNILGNEIFLMSINYTGNNSANMSPYNTISFSYKERDDKSYKFIAGQTFEKTKLLEKIEIENEGIIKGSYKFEYTFDDYMNKSKLYSIEKLDKNGNSFNKTLIDWGGLESSSTSSYNYNGEYLDDEGGRTIGDFNGDGKSDFIATDLSGQQQFYISNAVSFDHNTLSFNVSSGENMFSGDVNSDGIDELIVTTFDEVKIYNYSAASFSLLNTITISRNSIYNSAGMTIGNDNYLKVSVADVTGDGKNEIITYDEWFIFDILNHNYISVGVPENYPNIPIYLNLGVLATADLHLTDFDGNGISEIILQSSTGGDAAFEYDNQAGGFNIILSNLPTDITSTNEIRTFGDLNGDNKTDIIIGNGVQNNTVYLYNGSSFANYTLNLNKPQPGLDSPGRIRVGISLMDYNNDGYLDFVEELMCETYFGSNTYYPKNAVYLNQGIDIINNEFDFDSGYLGFGYFSFQPNSLISDFNGDGIIDNGRLNNNILFSDENKSLYVNGIFDGFNSYYKFDYQTLACDNSYITTTPTYPNNNFIGGNYIVKSMKQPNGIGGDLIKDYYYENGKVNREGIGFIGFDKVVTENPDGTKYVLDFDFDFNTNSGFNHYNHSLINVETRLISDNSLISLITNTYSNSFLLGGKQIINELTTKKEEFFIEDKTILTSYDINGNTGNINSVTEEYFDLNMTNLVFNKTTSFTYSSVSGWKYPHLVSSKTINNTRIGNNSYVRDLLYTYDLKGNLLTETTDPGTTNEVVTAYLNINDCGLPQEIQMSASGISTRQTFLTYDSKSRFITAKSNGIGVLFTKTYDPFTGAVLTETNIDGLQATYTYDDFGILVSKEDFNGVPTSYTKNWAATIPNSDNHLFIIKEVSPYNGYKELTFDVLGNLLISKRKIADNNQIKDVYVFYEYNAKGELVRKSDETNHINPALIKWTTYSYDNYGRKIEESYHNLQATTISYSPREVTVENSTANTYKNTKVDVLGNIIESTDNGGTIQYEYNSMNKVSEINTNGLVITKSYDDYGRLISDDNPNTGQYFYEYNSFGEKVKMIKPDGVEVSYLYDQYGRLEYEQATTGSQKHLFYKTQSPGNGKLFKVEMNNGLQTLYDFDNNGRIQSVTESINGQDFVFEYTYNDYGKLETQVYPSGLEILYDYDSYSGVLLNIINRETEEPISSVNAFNNNIGFGVVESYNLGTDINVVNNYNYDPQDQNYNTLEGITYSSISQSNVLIDRQYEFNPYNGNLESRTDLIRNLTESFNYDNLDRLVGHTFEHDYTTTYAPNGNILSNNQVGQYSYHSTKLNAVSSIESQTNQISQDLQETEYTYFNKVSRISQEGEVTKEANIIYGFDDQRRYMSYVDSRGVEKEVYYCGDYELHINGGESKEISYIGGINGLNAVSVIEQGEENIYYIAKDFLGSIIALYDNNSELIDENSYGPWGRKRNPYDWSFDLSYKDQMQKPDVIDRGYTQHEHLQEFQLINMNGRMYDPIIRRMTSPDILDQNPSNTQSYNRYSYAFNNPLRFTDPSGYTVTGGTYNSPPTSTINNVLDAIDNGYHGAHANWLEFEQRRDMYVLAMVMGELSRLEGGGGGPDQSLIGFFASFAGVSAGAQNNGDGEGGQGDSDANNNVPGGKWDFMGKGSVPYTGEKWFGTNFIGPGPNSNPYNLDLDPVDAIDKAAQTHDYLYWLEGASGVGGAFFNKRVYYADLLLVAEAKNIMNNYKAGGIDIVTGFQISERTYNIARSVYYTFLPLTINKITP